MRATLIGIAVILAMVFLGWLSFGNSDDFTAIVLDKQEVQEDTQEAAQVTKEAVDEASDAGEKLVEGARDTVDEITDGRPDPVDNDVAPGSGRIGRTPDGDRIRN